MVLEYLCCKCHCTCTCSVDKSISALITASLNLCLLYNVLSANSMDRLLSSTLNAVRDTGISLWGSNEGKHGELIWLEDSKVHVHVTLEEHRQANGIQASERGVGSIHL